MSQPPGRHGGGPRAYGPPGPYGPRGYGPPGPYGSPGSAAGPGSDGRPARKSHPILLIVAGTAVILLALAAGTYVLLRNDGSGTTPVAVSTPAAASTQASTAPPSESLNTEALPGGARVAEPPVAPAGGAFAGSDDVAVAWVQAMADGNWQDAFDLSCADVQEAATTAAEESSDPPYELGAYFFQHTLGGAGFTEGTFDSIEYSETTGTDVASFTLLLDSGEEFTLLVYVDETPAVCDFT